jgi:hypothetical protein
VKIWDSSEGVLLGENVLGIESEVVWATPGVFSNTNYPCDKDGSNCRSPDEKKNQTGCFDKNSNNKCGSEI